LIFKAVQTLRAKSSSSTRDAVRRAIQPRGDIDVLHPLSGVKHDPRALHDPPRQRHRHRTPLKLNALILRQLDVMPTSSRHNDYFATPAQAPSHNPQNLRTHPLARPDSDTSSHETPAVP
jgi:hypothetical protein